MDTKINSVLITQIRHSDVTFSHVIAWQMPICPPWMAEPCEDRDLVLFCLWDSVPLAFTLEPSSIPAFEIPAVRPLRSLCPSQAPP